MTRTDSLGTKHKRLRRSKRIRAKTKSKPRHIPLLIEQQIPYRSSQLKLKNTHSQRGSRGKLHKQQNQSIIDEKPYDNAWNTELLKPSYYIPIHDNYGSLFDESYKIRFNFIRIQQINDPFCFAIISFLNTGNKSLILDLLTYVSSSLLSSLLNKVHSNFHHGASKMYHIITNDYQYWWVINIYKTKKVEFLKRAVTLNIMH